MKNARTHIVVIIALLVGVVGVVAFAARGSGQSRGPKSKSPVSKSPVQPAVRITDHPTVSPEFAAAAVKNAELRQELNWTFGGKQQRGWYLYDLLIGKTLNGEHDPVSGDFAADLAKWQKKTGLSPSGVLDEDSLVRLVSQWQSNRLKNRAYADPSELIEAPPADFYDPGRAVELRQVERKTYSAYKEMMAAAAADPELKLGPKYLKIVSAFRPREYQDQLRRQSPNAGSAGLAVNSPHFTGRALDLYVGGDPVDTKDSNRAIQVNTPAYRWLVRHAEHFGFRPYFYEPWHWEYVK
ncbi:MAG TPA: D-alanyl-D-alanine carboxypeptidase family protein [Pyrinomonadaceae bacterium]|nr:D-alanyl-D-alanine carboxypeptidase family protein [Pyrinomonadaceae bacterium]